MLELPCIHPIEYSRQARGIRPRAISQGAGRTTSTLPSASVVVKVGRIPRHQRWSRHPDAGFQRPATSR